MLKPGCLSHRRSARADGLADAVHDRGAHLVIQLMHVGRMAHPDNTPHHRTPVAPSAIAPGVDMFTPTGKQPAPTPRALTVDQIAATEGRARAQCQAALRDVDDARPGRRGRVAGALGRGRFTAAAPQLRPG